MTCVSRENLLNQSQWQAMDAKKIGERYGQTAQSEQDLQITIEQQLAKLNFNQNQMDVESSQNPNPEIMKEIMEDRW